VSDDHASPDGRGFHHVPVLLGRVVDLFRDVPDGLYVDATLGGGGHALAVLDAHPGLRLLGLDRDAAACEAAAVRLAPHGGRVEIVRTGFDQLERLVRERTTEGASAVLMDLGVSSPQLDDAERGFSYRAAGPLDMRMDRRQATSALDVVNEYPYPQLVRVIETYGEERHARRIGRAIVDARPIADTAQLAEVVREAVPAAARRTGGHPAKRTFQAIRIEVNGELDALPAALRHAIDATSPGGRIAVLSYHSGEDRIVAGAFADAERASPPDASPFVHPDTVRRRVRRVRAPRRPSQAELERNPRASAAKLRVVEKVGR